MKLENIKAIDVSVIIAAWNSEKFISNAIDSALAQEGVCVEVIVVDDCSIDGTCQVVESYTDERVRLIRSDVNGGPGAARNFGFSVAKGQWIAVLDSDDFYQENRLSRMLQANQNKADILIDNVFEQQQGTSDLSPYYQSNELPTGSFSLDFLIRSNLIYTDKKSTGYVKPIFRREFIEGNNIKYWPEIRIGEDYYFLACCLAKGANAVVFDICAYIYTIRAGSISEKMTVQHLDRLLVADKKFIDCYNLTEKGVIAQHFRTSNLERAKKFINLVTKLKKKKLLGALKIAVSSPRTACLLWLPIRKRLIGR
jgi:succinoglycan biosynthesis protein ExoO